MASPPQPTGLRVLSPAPAAAESDDVLRHIFLCLDSPADLARACAASRAFRRVITDPLFLRRFRALHPPPLLAVLSNGFHPAEPPHPSAAAARAFADAAAADANFFSCSSFLPSPGPWHFSDSRDGRVLLYGDHEGSCCYSPPTLGSCLAVCDPLHRRYLVLPPIPESLAALVEHERDDVKYFLAPPAEDEEDNPSFSFLAPPHGDEEEEGKELSQSPPSFRVICLAEGATKLIFFIFSSSAAGAGGQPWRAAKFDGWRALNSGIAEQPWHAAKFDGWSALNSGTAEPHRRSLPSLLRHSYAHGRFYWPVYFGKHLLVLDARRRDTVSISSVTLPPVAWGSLTAFVEATPERQGGEGRLAMVRICRLGTYYLSYRVLRDDGEWEREPTIHHCIHLPLHYDDYCFMGAAGGYLLLEAKPEGRDLPVAARPDVACFSLDLRSLKIEWFCGSKWGCMYAPLYVGFPPNLSPPTV